MFAQHPVAAALTRMGAFNVGGPVLDSVKTKPAPVLDDASSSNFAQSALRMDVAALFQQWCETEPDDLDSAENETMADRLFAMFVGLADEDHDGDITPDEEAYITVAMETGLDYLTGKGVSDDDALALLNDGDAGAADRVCELLKSSLPDGEDASLKELDEFAFGGEANEGLFDSILDAVYKKTAVVRDGHKVRINKRISGKVRLSAAQRVGINKAHRKANTASAKMHRMKSMRVRAQTGL